MPSQVAIEDPVSRIYKDFFTLTNNEMSLSLRAVDLTWWFSWDWDFSSWDFSIDFDKYLMCV